MNKKSKKGVSAKTVIGVVAGVAALSAAAYVLFGPEGKKNRKIIRSWAVKMKSEIIEKFENAKEITEPVYHEIINNVQAKYAKMKNVDQKELTNVVNEIKKHWKDLKKEATRKKTKPAKKTKKIVRK
jgi:gas vesicle protein